MTPVKEKKSNLRRQIIIWYHWYMTTSAIVNQSFSLIKVYSHTLHLRIGSNDMENRPTAKSEFYNTDRKSTMLTQTQHTTPWPRTSWPPKTARSHMEQRSKKVQLSAIMYQGHHIASFLESNTLRLIEKYDLLRNMSHLWEDNRSFLLGLFPSDVLE